MEWLLHKINQNSRYLNIIIVSPQVAVFCNPCIVRLKSKSEKNYFTTYIESLRFSPRTTCHISYCSLGTLVSWPATRKYYWSPCFVKSFGDHWVACVHLVRVTVTTIQLQIVNSPRSKCLKAYNK